MSVMELAVSDPSLDVVELTLTIPAGADRLALYRVGPSGVRAYVRGYGEAEVTPGTIVVRDFEAPIGVPLTYTAETWNAATPETVTTSSETITIPAEATDDPWLCDLARPTNSQRVTVISLAELTYSTPIGVHYILGRRVPIVSSDISNAPSFELVFATLDEAAYDRARAALGNGIPILLRTPPEQGVGSIYFAATAWKDQRVSRIAQYAERRFVVECVQVDRPDPILYVPLPPATYASVAANFASYAELKAERASYDAVAYDYEGTEASDIVPWPPTDV